MEGDCVTDAVQEAEEEKVHSATQSFCEALSTSPKHLDWFLRLTSSLILIFTLHQGLKSWTPNLRVPLNIASQMASFFFSLLCFHIPIIFHFLTCLFKLSVILSESLKDHKTFLLHPESLHHSCSCFDLQISKKDEVLYKGKSPLWQIFFPSLPHRRLH